MIFLVPLLMGGRHAVGQLALTVLAVAAAWAWAARQCLRDDAALAADGGDAADLLAGWCWSCCRPFPCRRGCWPGLRAHTARLLPLWNARRGDARLAWTLVLHFASRPPKRWAGLVLFLDFALLFFVAVQRIRHVEDVERLLRWCALSAVIMASFGIVQLLAGNGKFFWFYEHPFTDTSDVRQGQFQQPQSFRPFPGPGNRPADLVAAGRHAPRATDRGAARQPPDASD